MQRIRMFAATKLETENRVQEGEGGVQTGHEPQEVTSGALLGIFEKFFSGYKS